MQSQPYPLLNLTNKPRIYSDFELGGDNLVGFYLEHLLPDNPLFNKLKAIKIKYSNAITDRADPVMFQKVEKEYDAFKNELFCAISSYHQDNEFIVNHNKMLDAAIHNENQRLRIVDAIGGIEFVKTVPVIYPENVNSYPYFKLTDIPDNHSMAQFEDFAGRKGLLMKVNDKTSDKHLIVWFNQRYRETELGSQTKGSGALDFIVGCQGGDLWMGNIKNNNMEGVDDIVNFINQVKSGTHPSYVYNDNNSMVI
jgi:hypothetical protein